MPIPASVKSSAPAINADTADPIAAYSYASHIMEEIYQTVEDAGNGNYTVSDVQSPPRHFFHLPHPCTRNLLHAMLTVVCLATVLQCDELIRYPIEEYHTYFYHAFTIIGALLSSTLLHLLGSRWSMVLASITYTFYVIGTLLHSIVFYYISILFLGIGSSTFFVTVRVYCARNTPPGLETRNSAIFWTLTRFSWPIVAVILLSYQIVGIDGHSENSIDVISRVLVLTILCVITTGLLYFLPSQMAGKIEQMEKSREKSAIVTIFRQLGTRRMLLLSVVFAYEGLTTSFVNQFALIFNSVLPEEYTGKFSSPSWQMATIGIIYIVGGLIFGLIGVRWGRGTLVAIAVPCHLLSYMGCGIVNSNLFDGLGKRSPFTALTCIVLHGLGSLAWGITVTSHVMFVYPTQTRTVFAIECLWQSFFTLAALLCSQYANVAFSISLMTMAVICVVALGCYIFVEQEARLIPRSRLPSQVPVQIAQQRSSAVSYVYCISRV